MSKPYFAEEAEALARRELERQAGALRLVIAIGRGGYSLARNMLADGIPAVVARKPQEYDGCAELVKGKRVTPMIIDTSAARNTVLELDLLVSKLQEGGALWVVYYHIESDFRDTYGVFDDE